MTEEEELRQRAELFKNSSKDRPFATHDDLQQFARGVVKFHENIIILRRWLAEVNAEKAALLIQIARMKAERSAAERELGAQRREIVKACPGCNSTDITPDDYQGWWCTRCLIHAHEPAYWQRVEKPKS